MEHMGLPGLHIKTYDKVSFCPDPHLTSYPNCCVIQLMAVVKFNIKYFPLIIISVCFMHWELVHSVLVML